MSDWVRIQAKSGSKDIWLDVQADNKPEIMSDPWLMPDGKTKVDPFVEECRLDEIPFPVWFAPYTKGKRLGDMLWTGGSGLKIASQRMIDALQDANITGYRTFDVDVRDHAGDPIKGYVGFATDPGPTTDIQNILGQDGQNFVFIANQRVVEALRAHGADDLDIRPYDPSEFD